MCRPKAEGGRRCPGCAAPTARATADHNGRRRGARHVQRLREHGIPACPARALPELYWWDAGGGPLRPSKAAPLEDPTSVLWKPEGGIWSAPALESADELEDGRPATGWHTTWTDRLADDYPGGGHLTTLIPRASAVAVHLRSLADLEAVRQRWPHVATTVLGEQIHGFSFTAMRNDGVDVVYVDDGPLLTTDSLVGTWDVPSAVWLMKSPFTPGGRTPVTWSARY